MTGPLTLVIVDDDPNFPRLLKSRLDNEGLRILTAASGEEVLELIQKGETTDILASDFVMPGGMDGSELVNQALALRPELYTIIFTGYMDRDFAIRSLRAGVHIFIDKDEHLEKELRAAVRRAVQQITMDRFGRDLLNLRSQTEVFELTIRALRRLNRFEGCCLAVWGRERTSYRVQQAVSLETGSRVPGPQVAGKDSAYRWVIETGQSYLPPLFVPEDGEKRPYLRESSSVVIVPVHLENGERGALGVEHEEARRLDVDDLRFMNRLAAWVSLAMERITERHRVQVVGEFSRGRSDLLARTIVHELKNPLQTLSIIAQEMQDGDVEASQRQTLLQTVSKINNAVNQHLRPLVNERPEVSSVDVAELLEEAVERFRLYDPDHRTAIHTTIDPSLPRVRGNRDLLVSAFFNLLNNGSEAAGNDGELQVSAQYLRPRKRIEVVIRDNGPGVPQASRSRIFDYGFSTRPHENRGYGLALTKDLVESCGGDISLVDTKTQGAAFKIGFPPESEAAEVWEMAAQ